jgi:hypothetical protein
MKNVLKHADKRQGIPTVQRLSILVENRSQSDWAFVLERAASDLTIDWALD